MNLLLGQWKVVIYENKENVKLEIRTRIRVPTSRVSGSSWDHFWVSQGKCTKIEKPFERNELLVVCNVIKC